MKFSVNSIGFGMNGMPFLLGRVANAAGPFPSGLSNPDCETRTCRRWPKRNSLTMVGDNVDTSESVKTLGRRLYTPPELPGHGGICVSEMSHSRVPVKNTLLFALKLWSRRMLN